MPKYRVVTAIEHNQILYLPEANAPVANAKSVSNGKDIPVDNSGTIELDGAQASSFTQGQIAPLAAPSTTEEPKRQRGRSQQ